MKFIIATSYITLFLHISVAQEWQLVGFEDYEIEHVYAKGDTLWVGTKDSTLKREVFYSFSGGDKWQKVADTDALINGVLQILRINPNNSLIIYTVSVGRSLKSVDGGKSWQVLFPDLEPWPRNTRVTDVFISPHNTNTIFAIIHYFNAAFNSDNLYRSKDQGKNWEYISTDFPSSSHGSTFTIAYDPIDSLKMYAAANDELGGWFFYKSNNHGAQWLLSSLAGSRHILPHISNPDTIYLFPSREASYDNGVIWQRTLKEIIIPDTTRQPRVISANQMSTHPFDIFTLILKWGGETLGIFKKTLGADSWNVLPGSEKLNFSPSLNFKILLIDPMTNKLYVGTKKGLYCYNLITSIDETDYNPKGFKLYQNYPNPFNPITKIDYRLAMNSEVTLKIYDISGREIITLVSGQKNAGEHSVSFEAAELPSGIYFYRLKTSSGFSQSRKMVLIK